MENHPNLPMIPGLILLNNEAKIRVFMPVRGVTHHWAQKTTGVGWRNRRE